MLYAHWEGFIKSAATSYVAFVATRGLRFSDLSPNFVALGLRSDILSAGLSRLATLHTALTTKFLYGLSDRASINWEEAIDTRSNLNAKTLLEKLCILSVDNTQYLTKSAVIDQKLLAHRNVIAHGGRLEIEQADYESLYNQIIELAEWFRTNLENAASLNSYMRKK